MMKDFQALKPSVRQGMWKDAHEIFDALIWMALIQMVILAEVAVIVAVIKLTWEIV